MPDDGLTVTVTNAAQFSSAMDHIRAELAEPKAPLEAAARELVTAAAAAAPRASGRLAGSHRALPAAGRKIRIIADTPYAAAIHWGWPAHHIGRRPWLVATWLRNQKPLEAATAAVQASIDKAAAAT